MNYYLKRVVLALTGWIPDKLFLQLTYYLRLRRVLHLSNPRTFTEKLQWLKLYDKNPIYPTIVDKYAAKQYVANIIGSDHIIPTLGVWESVEDIDWDSLPSQFVLKCTHDSGGVHICKDKESFDFGSVKKQLKNHLKIDFYKEGREWPYKAVPKRIIAEKYIGEEEGLKDYKFFCFNGKVRFFKIDFGRFVDHHANYYDLDCKLLPFGEEDYPPIPEKDLDIPDNIKEMFTLAEKLSRGFSFVRVDLFNTDNHIFFGEMTLYPGAGYGLFTPEEWNVRTGDMIQLS